MLLSPLKPDKFDIYYKLLFDDSLRSVNDYFEPIEIKQKGTYNENLFFCSTSGIENNISLTGVNKKTINVPLFTKLYNKQNSTYYKIISLCRLLMVDLSKNEHINGLYKKSIDEGYQGVICSQKNVTDAALTKCILLCDSISFMIDTKVIEEI